MKPQYAREFAAPQHDDMACCAYEMAKKIKKGPTIRDRWAFL